MKRPDQIVTKPSNATIRENLNILVVYLDGIQFGKHHVEYKQHFLRYRQVQFDDYKLFSTALARISREIAPILMIFGQKSADIHLR